MVWAKHSLFGTLDPLGKEPAEGIPACGGRTIRDSESYKHNKSLDPRGSYCPSVAPIVAIDFEVSRQCPSTDGHICWAGFTKCSFVLAPGIVSEATVRSEWVSVYRSLSSCTEDETTVRLKSLFISCCFPALDAQFSREEPSRACGYTGTALQCEWCRSGNRSAA